MLQSTLIAQLVLRNAVPAHLKALLLLLLFCTALLYVANARWFESIRHLASIPLQRFNWQSEQFLGNALFRVTSLFLSSLTAAIFIYTYSLGAGFWYHPNQPSSFLLVIACVGLCFILKLCSTIVFFKIHRNTALGSQVLDFHYSLNQLFSLLLGILLFVDVFYTRLDSSLYHFTVIIALIYFLVRLYGTILLLQNSFNYPILTVFVYLCTFEIVPALVIAKVLFVNT
jgi:uncharacterized membrane protein YiaA